MTENNIEKRCSSGKVTRAADSRKVEGYALKWGVESDGLWFREKIMKGAIDQAVIDKSDVRALLNHDDRRGILARYFKDGDVDTLSLTVDDTGLKYEFDAPETALGDELLSYLERGEITTSSFAFTIEDVEWVDGGDGEEIRLIKKIDELFDVSPVFRAAYSDTSVAKREFEARKAEKEPLEKDKKKTKQEARKFNREFLKQYID